MRKKLTAMIMILAICLTLVSPAYAENMDLLAGSEEIFTEEELPADVPDEADLALEEDSETEAYIPDESSADLTDSGISAPQDTDSQPNPVFGEDGMVESAAQVPTDESGLALEDALIPSDDSGLAAAEMTEDELLGAGAGVCEKQP